MNGTLRELLRAAVDARRRAQAGVDPRDCGDAASANSYRYGCRCRACTKAATDHKRERRQARLIVVSVHNRCGYENGCRCDTCTDAKRVYNRAWRQRRKAAT